MQTLIVKNLSYSTEQKSDKKNYMIEGYISTSDLDRVGDIVTKECLEDMLVQIKTKNIKLDVEHEVTESSKLPIGRIIDAKLDSVGLYVKAVLNDASPEFENVWKSIRNGFLDAFSILYRPVAAVDKFVNGKKARMLNKLDLVNVALTGNPVNPQCVLTDAFAKSLNSLKGENMENTQEAKSEKVEAKAEGQMPGNQSANDNAMAACPMGDNCPYAKKYKSMVEEQKMCGAKKAEEAPAKDDEEDKDKEMEKSIKSLTDAEAKNVAKIAELEKQIVEMKSILTKPILKSIGPERDSVSKTAEPEAKSIKGALDLI